MRDYSYLTYVGLVAPQGFEPRSIGSESLVLPLNRGNRLKRSRPPVVTCWLPFRVYEVREIKVNVGTGFATGERGFRIGPNFGAKMFERYTEKARRVIFYARDEASRFGVALYRKWRIC